MAAIGPNSDVNSADQFERMAPEKQAQILAWIRETFAPSEHRCRLGSYVLKHHFERDAFYVTNGQFKGAMLAAGHDPVDPNERNWVFQVTLPPSYGWACAPTDDRARRENEAQRQRHEPRVYVLFAERAGLFKIGIAGDVEKRLRQLQSNSGDTLHLLYTCPGGRKFEASLHEYQSAFRVRGEWFKPNEMILTWLRKHAGPNVFDAVHALRAWPPNPLRRHEPEVIPLKMFEAHFHNHNTLLAVAGTTGYRHDGGDQSGITLFEIENAGCTKVKFSVDEGGDRLKVELRGDAELTTIIQALRFIADTLAREAGPDPGRLVTE